MNKTGIGTDFFLAANAPVGFVSYFDELCDETRFQHLLIVKGGPGCGKSTLMGKLARSRRGKENLQLIHCSADPDSLDGVVFLDSKLCVVDGTSPHVIEPKYPGAFERVINLYDCLDIALLEQKKEEIITAYRKNKQLLARGRSFVGSAGALIGEIYQIAAPYTDNDKIRRYAKGLAKKLVPRQKEGRGTESKRFFTCIGAGEKGVFLGNIPALCDKTVILHDRWGAAGRVFMEEMKEHFLEAGYDVTACPCPLFPHSKLEHLFVPELRLGLFTSNDFHKISIPSAKNIHARRFTQQKALEEKRARIRFHIKAAKNLLAQTQLLMEEAKEWHDKLEGIYVSACDFSKVDTICKKLIKEYF